ncbi:MAG TPA: helix-turn-helix domain-containing protein, partial [Ardenticatenaceae bacterium]|nr:helix-turn-helix domain-containing protein [Ardenticatenaceae bacterium]
MDQATSFAQALKQRRKAHDLTQQQLAQRVGCAVVTIQRIEQGRLRPSRQTVQRLAAILDIPADECEQFVRLARSVPLPDTPEPQLDAPTRAPAAGSLLPMPLAPLIGRAPELTLLGSMLLRGTVRLLTLTGPGGIGKTGLAIQLAHALASHFRNGVVFVSLAPLSDPDLVIPAVGQALSLREAGRRPMAEQLQAHLRTRELLLLLDNFEQVIEAGTEVAALLRACPGLKCLVTSRIPLHLSGEHQHPVSPLALPPAEPHRVPLAEGAGATALGEDVSAFPAVELFVQRA